MECWRENIYQNMIEAAKKRPLLSTFQGKLLKSFIDNIEYKQCLDIGCGTCQIKELINGFYVGVDLPEIINNVSRKLHEQFYRQRDVTKDRIDFVGQYDLVIMSAFIDVMEKPIETLEKILKHCNKYVIIHRQELTKGKTVITKEPSYGGWTYHSKINWAEFMKAIKGFEIIQQASCKYPNWFEGGHSFLLKRND